MLALAVSFCGADQALGSEPTHAAASEPAPGLLPFEITSLAHESLAAQVAYFSGPGRRQAATMISRAGALEPELRSQLAEAGAPAELIWVAAIESGFEPNAGSRAGAAGLWQIVPATADALGLTHDARVDQRRHVRASTEAAARLLLDLRNEFGSWPLALAAYNMGAYGVRQALAGQTPTDFWTFERNQLLPSSVRRYVTKIVALAVVATAPERFGLSGIQSVSARDVAEFVVAVETPLAAFARTVDLTSTSLRSLNPWLRGTRLLPGDSVYLPPAALDRLRDAAVETYGADRLRTTISLYGEEADDVADRFGVTPELLRQLNGWPRRFEPAYETEILVPTTATERPEHSERPLATLPRLSFSFPDRARWFYRVNRQDRLEALSARVGLPVEEIALWNDVDPKVPLRTGSMLALWLPQSFRPDGILLWPESAVTLVSDAGVPAAAKGSSVRRTAGSKRAVHTVRAGEALSSIARRYKVRVADLRRWNDLDEDEVILVGQPLVVGR